ncbi:MAG: MBL fold metallo-hydrolase, partial [Myxococcota bacterium]
MVRLQLGGLNINAHSIGGVETCFQVPDFDICLDIGRCPTGAEKRSVLLLTHAHIDHAAGLPYYVSIRSLMNLRPPRIFCPSHDRDALQAILNAWTKLQADSDRCQLNGVKPGDEIRLPRGHVARTFRSPHRISTVGYTVYSHRKKLKAELHGLS